MPSSSSDSKFLVCEPRMASRQKLAISKTYVIYWYNCLRAFNKTKVRKKMESKVLSPPILPDPCIIFPHPIYIIPSHPKNRLRSPGFRRCSKIPMASREERKTLVTIFFSFFLLPSSFFRATRLEAIATRWRPLLLSVPFAVNIERAGSVPVVRGCRPIRAAQVAQKGKISPRLVADTT